MALNFCSCSVLVTTLRRPERRFLLSLQRSSVVMPFGRSRGRCTPFVSQMDGCLITKPYHPSGVRDEWGAMDDLQTCHASGVGRPKSLLRSQYRCLVLVCVSGYPPEPPCKRRQGDVPHRKSAGSSMTKTQRLETAFQRKQCTICGKQGKHFLAGRAIFWGEL